MFSQVTKIHYRFTLNGESLVLWVCGHTRMLILLYSVFFWEVKCLFFCASRLHEQKLVIPLIRRKLACVASVSSRGSSRKLGQEQKKMNDGRGEGNEGTSSPLSLPLQPFFCFRSNFRAITRLETLATQARRKLFGCLQKIMEEFYFETDFDSD